jgi:hypothetical protein
MNNQGYKDSAVISFWAIICGSFLFLYIFSTHTDKTEEVVPSNIVEDHVMTVPQEELEFPYQTGDTISDLERLQFLDSLLLEDVREAYGFQTLEEYFEKHDSLVTIGTEYHYQYINKNK